MIGPATLDPSVDRYLARFGEFAGERSRSEPRWLTRLRRDAIARFGELGFPSPRDEAWRFTPVSAVIQTPFEPAPARRNGVAAGTLRTLTFPAARRLVFVNGHVSLELSTVDVLPPGVVVGSLAEAVVTTPELVEPHLGRAVRFDEQPFAALNTAFWVDGAFVYLPAGSVLRQPIHLLFLGTGAGGAEVAFPRSLIVAEAGSQAAIVESYVGLGDGTYFTCAVTELEVGPNAVLDHTKVQQESLAAYHIATQQLVQKRDSVFTSSFISTGGALVRTDVNGLLDGEGVDCTLNGLYLAGGRQHVDTHMLVEHAQPHGTSRELYKGILDGQARAVFNGRIYVRPGAQKTDAKQSNRNLLLSDEALVNSNPQLEIFANDVRCTHGSTVGQLDQEAIYYLRTRGIGAAAARSILTYAFASDVLSRIRVEPVRRDLEQLLLSRLPEGDVVRQAM